MKADMHMHSVYSDGELTINELVNIIKNEKLDLALLTDHDTLDGSFEFVEALKKEGIISYPACEFTTFRNNEPIHVLAVYKSFDNIKDEMFVYLKDMKERRINRLKDMTDNVNKIFNLDIDFNEIKKKHKNTLSRPHLAEEISQKLGISTKEVFEKYIGNDSPAYIPSTKLDTKDGVDLIKRTNGYAILAHPYLYKKNTFQDLMNLGFDGVEIFYSPTPIKKYKKPLRYALKHNLIITGGSDFHKLHDSSSHRLIGTSTIEDEYIKSFIERMNH